jgi:hypothetical protein
MDEIYALEKTKRYLEAGKSPRISKEAEELAKTLTCRQKSLLAKVISDAADECSFEMLYGCLISPSCFPEDLRQANRVLDRHQDGKLYSSHTQGPESPIEEPPETMKPWL